MVHDKCIYTVLYVWTTLFWYIIFQAIQGENCRTSLNRQNKWGCKCCKCNNYHSNINFLISFISLFCLSWSLFETLLFVLVLID